jgi:hypothetical protein
MAKSPTFTFVGREAFLTRAPREVHFFAHLMVSRPCLYGSQYPIQAQYGSVTYSCGGRFSGATVSGFFSTSALLVLMNNGTAWPLNRTRPVTAGHPKISTQSPQSRAQVMFARQPRSEFIATCDTAPHANEYPTIPASTAIAAAPTRKIGRIIRCGELVDAMTTPCR